MDKASKYLFDIQSAISMIEAFMQGIKSFEDYNNDLKTQSAVERQLAIIGEVVNKLSQEGVQLNNAKQMIDFRNRLIHSYDNIDNSIVWVILKRHIPSLKTEIEGLLS
ncbi:MAG: DUF86 domain-containing protein [Bacteroidales bacterium]|jgi:uncharacterized protein with HEPN domain|nr:DUF86 domain-containing protein [Bacteroidales bacterium]